ncbi:unnamed protein product [Rangifer tarandus platyrhynchus]|uniref:Uncharacterized protein n=1 Tax=Rangifer tarandus platyrhynchus TaxID=3082113 RepID=A0ABN8XUW0_RANTA|nr:unnamed protein product [Rangifer tarandus platyrhynchus]
MGYLTHLYFHLHLIKPTKAEWTLKVKGGTVLDHVVFWFGCADRQVKTRRPPFSLCDLAGPEAAFMPDPGPGEVPAAATALPPALREFVEPLFRQAPIPAMETSGQHPQNSTSAGPPRLYPPLPLQLQVSLLDPPQEGEDSIPRRPGGRQVDYTKDPTDSRETKIILKKKKR